MRPILRPIVSPLLTDIASAARRAFSWRNLFTNGTPGFRINIEEAIRLNKAAIGSKTSGFTPEELAACVAFQDSAGTLPVTAMEQPLGYIKDLSGNGNHFIQPSNTASRPIVSRRVNLLTNTDGGSFIYFAGLASYAVSALSPRGDMTARRIVEDTSTGRHNFYTANTTVVAGATYKFSIRVRRAVGSRNLSLQVLNIGGTTYPAVVVNLETGALVSATPVFSNVNVVAIENGYWEISLTGTPTTNITALTYFMHDGSGIEYTGDGESAIDVWGADIRLSIDANLPPYQRVTSASDYDESGFPAYARFDGLDDWLESGVVDMSSTDEVTVIAGVAKLSDAAAGIVIESSVNATSNAGAIALYAPDAAAATYEYTSRGTTSADATASGQAAPHKSLLSGVSKISTDTAVLRINGVQAATSATDQGTGNYAAQKFYMGRRAGTSLPFKGRLYGVTVVGKLLTDGQLAAAERAERNLGRLY